MLINLREKYVKIYFLHELNSNISKMSSTNKADVSSNFKGTMYDFTDPARLGPGMWHIMHVISKWSDGDPIKEEHASQLFEAICDNFKCGECNGHCEKYVRETDPPRNHAGIKNGLFDWTIDFRNAVQKRKERPNLYDHNIMDQIFTDRSFMACTEGCGETKSNSNIQSNFSIVRVGKYPDYVDVYGVGDRHLNQLSIKAPNLVQPIGSINIAPRKRK